MFNARRTGLRPARLSLRAFFDRVASAFGLRAAQRAPSLESQSIGCSMPLDGLDPAGSLIPSLRFKTVEQ
jgi:hypothetical protein